MAKYDYGGGCGCGLYSECLPDCEWNKDRPIGKKEKKEKKEKLFSKNLNGF